MYSYLVESNKLIAKNILYLRLKSKSLDDIFAFTPGQYACLSFTHDGRRSPARCFSIASSPHERGVLEFGIRTEGDYTTSLTKLTAGDSLEVQGPFGNFLDDTVRANEIVFFAGGIGVTPFISAIRTAAQLNFPQKITLFYSVRTFNDAAYINELADLQNSSPNFNLYLFLSKENASSYKSPRILSGQVSDAAIIQILQNNFTGKKFFICGPGAFMSAMRNNLAASKVNPANILTEEFSAAGNKQSGTDSNKKIVKWITAGVAASFVLIAWADASGYSSRLEAALRQQNSLANPAAASNNSTVNSVPSTDDSTIAPVQNSTNNVTNNNTGSSVPPTASNSNNSIGSTTPVQNTYTPPMSRMS